MTDEMRVREEAICEVAGIKDIGDLSDGFHTFNQLYYQRMMLFATIVKQNRDRAWKSLRHEDGELCFGGGWFIVGIDTPEGSYTYHYEDNYYSLFDCVELERAKHWDGHTEKDVTRLLSLPALEMQEQAENEWCPDCAEYDKENHCCHRFTKVIRQTVEECKREWANEGWIPVTERLPEDEYVLISKKPTKLSGSKWSVCIGIRTADPRSRKIQWRDSGFGIIQDDKVLAWRPLPEPYTEDEDEEQKSSN